MGGGAGGWGGGGAGWGGGGGVGCFVGGGGSGGYGRIRELTYSRIGERQQSGRGKALDLHCSKH